MIIEIESVYGDSLIFGKNIGESELRLIVKELIALVGEENFASSFCARYGYEASAEEVKVDYVIDLDAHKVYKPKY